MPSINFASATELTIAAGVITVTRGYHKVAGESAASDDLVTINGGTDGDLLILYPSSSAQDITLKHGTGNIVIGGDADYTIPDNGYVLLMHDGTNWRLDPGGSSLWTDDGDGTISRASAVDVTGTVTATSVSTGTIKEAAGSNTAITNNSDGSVNLPNQPAFSVEPASTQTNIAVGSYVTVVFGTEIFDIGGNFAANTFTAPVAGKYQLNVSLTILELDTASTQFNMEICTSNRTYSCIFKPNTRAADFTETLSLSVLADMDASDTAYVRVYQTGGAQQTDIYTLSNFSGFLAL